MNDDATLHDAKLQEVARRLGAHAAERLDVERTAQAVVARLRTEPRAQVRVLGWRSMSGSLRIQHPCQGQPWAESWASFRETSSGRYSKPWGSRGRGASSKRCPHRMWVWKT